MKTFWAHEDDDTGSWDNIDDAIEDYLTNVKERPEEIVMVQYKPVDVDSSVMFPLEHCLETLDEVYESVETTQPTQKMLDAEKALIDAVLEGFVPGQVDVVSHRKVNVVEWCRKHHPEWIGEE